MTDQRTSGVNVETLGVASDVATRVSAVGVEILGEVDPRLDLSAMFVEVLGERLPVSHDLSTLFVEVVGSPSVVSHDLSAMFIEVMGVPGEYNAGLPNVAGTGYLFMKHSDGTWKQPRPIALI